MTNLRAYGRLIQLESTSRMSGGVLYFLSGYFVRFIRTLLLLGVWRTIFSNSNTANPGQLNEVLRYTLLGAIFWQQIDVQTTLSTTYWEGTASSRFLRPLSVFGQFIAETVGKWVPGLILSSLPLLLLAPALGVDLRPAGPLTLLSFSISLSLGVTCGFAMDLIFFSGIMVYLGNANYIALQIRYAVVMLLSGALIPLQLLPFNLGAMFARLPFATMASAPLSIYTGMATDVGQIILLQLGWGVILWMAALFMWQKNRQKMVVFGG